MNYYNEALDIILTKEKVLSLNINEESLIEQGYSELIINPPYKFGRSYIPNGVSKVDGVFTVTYTIDDSSVDTVVIDAIRRKRDKLLESSDWVVLADCPLSAEDISDWKTYRQSLRDITLGAVSVDMNFPLKPKTTSNHVLG